jgi:protein arginine kinase
MLAPNKSPLTVTDMLKEFLPWVNSSNPSYPLNRYTLHRNIAGFTFSEKISKAEAVDVCKKLVTALFTLFPTGQFFPSKEITDQEHHLIFEHLYLAGRECIHPEGGIFIDPTNNILALIHLEDHLTLFFHETTRASEEILEKITSIDQELQTTIPFAYSDLFGYLTTSAIYLGTGLSKEAIIHAPALNLLGASISDHSKVLIHGLNGEKEALNNLIIITNKYCLGVSEKNIIYQVDEIADKIFQAELSAKKTLSEDPEKKFINDLSKKFGAAFFSKELQLHEALSIASAIDLGISLELIESKRKTFYFDLFFNLRRAHLEAYFPDKSLSVNEKRAHFFKEKLNDIKLNT